MWKDKLAQIRLMIVHERNNSEYIVDVMPELTKEERSNIILECDESIRKLSALNFGDTRIYSDIINDYKKIKEKCLPVIHNKR